ncbi:hypothetical protein O3P69_008700 [Scylla paramamosain]|uniref:Uncharacterized protein n=1 Tax=Scylla paramamosain TaxID=85552 RepID=A0AAW0SLU4_SCYPA
MKNTVAFLLFLPLLLLLLLLLPGECHGSSFAQQCSFSFQTVDDKYLNITTAQKTTGDQISITMYVRPHQDLKVVLGVEGSAKYYTDFLLEKGCFNGYSQWGELWVKAKQINPTTRNNQRYKLQVRTSTCTKPCIAIIENMSHFDSLHVWASGASQWRLDHPGRQCGTIPQWMRDYYLSRPFPTCTNVNPSSLLTTHVKPTTPAKSTATLTKHKATLTKPPPTKLSAAHTGAIIGGLVAGSVLVTFIVMTVVRKRRGQAATKDVAVDPQNTESRREENVNSLYEPNYRQQPLYENVDRQGSVNSLYETVDRQGSLNSLYETVDRQEPLYETVDRQGSLNSLYEPFEKFRGTQ